MTIRPGDRVSWRFEVDCAPRCFGFVARDVKRTCELSTRKKHAFSVQGDDGVYRVIAARFITKECE